MTKDFFNIKPTKEALNFFSLLQNIDNDLSDIIIHLPDKPPIYSRCKSLRTNNIYFDNLLKSTFNDVTIYEDGTKILNLNEDCDFDILHQLLICFSYPGEFKHRIRIYNVKTVVSYNSLINTCKFVTIIDKWSIHQFQPKIKEILDEVKKRMKLFNLSWINQRKKTYEGRVIISNKPLPIVDIEPINTDMLNFWMNYFPSSSDVLFFILINASSFHREVSKQVFEQLIAPNSFNIYLETLQAQDIIERIFYSTLFNIKQPNIFYYSKKQEEFSDEETSNFSNENSPQ